MKIFLISIFYIILSAFFIYIFVKEKKISEKMKKKQDIFVENLLYKMNILSENIHKNVKKVFNVISSIVIAVALVLVLQRFYIGNFNIPTGSMIPTIEIKDRVFANMVKYKFIDPKREEIIVFKEPIENKNLYTKRIMALPGEKVRIKNNKLYINDIAIESRRYSNLGIEDNSWVVPKKGDILKIIPALNYASVYKENSIDIAKIQEALQENAAMIANAMPQLKFYLNGEETAPILDFIHDKEILSKLLNGETVEFKLKENYFFALGDNTDGSYDSRFWGFVAKNRIRGEVFVRFWPLNRIGLVK